VIRPPISIALVAAGLVAAALVQPLLGHWRLSSIAAPLVAYLLWSAHRRARFAAYVLLSVMAARGLVGREWWSVALAVAAILVLQLPAARRHCPRLAPRPRDKMPAP
jgi:hypothetical protein